MKTRLLIFAVAVVLAVVAGRIVFHLDTPSAVPAISGEHAWQPVTVDIPAATHVLRWLYHKDRSFSAGQDRGCIDQVAILRADYGLRLPAPDPGGAFVLLPVRKDATAGFFVEQTTDFVTWTPAGFGDGMVTPRFTNVNLIRPHPGPRGFYRMRFKPEIVHAIENAGFEQPAVSAQSFANNAPGWGPDDDAFTATSFEHIIGFAAAGTQHLSIDAGFFSEMKGSFLGYRGAHSVMAAIGHRPGFTQPGNLSSIVLKSGPELARVALGAAGQPSGSWFTPVPATFDSFETNLDAAYNYKVRLESTVSRGFFDEIRVVTEPQ
jgi:hypothetical protein